MNGLTVVIATRGRPAILAETLDHFLRHAELATTRILVCADRDDVATTEHAADLPTHWRIQWSIREREDTRGQKYDRALSEAPADLYLIGVDHTPVLTPGYDRIFLDAAGLYPDGIGIVSTKMANASFPYLQAVTARWAQLAGYLQPPDFPFWFIDHWLDDVARMTGRYGMVDVEVHSDAHPGKTTGMSDLAFWANYYMALEGERREQANRIIDALDEPDWRKAVLRSSFGRVAAWSNYINFGVAQHAAEIEAHRAGAPLPPAIYQRVKARAEAKLARLRPEAA